MPAACPHRVEDVPKAGVRVGEVERLVRARVQQRLGLRLLRPRPELGDRRWRLRRLVLRADPALDLEHLGRDLAIRRIVRTGAAVLPQRVLEPFLGLEHASHVEVLVRGGPHCLLERNLIFDAIGIGLDCLPVVVHRRVPVAGARGALAEPEGLARRAPSQPHGCHEQQDELAGYRARRR